MNALLKKILPKRVRQRLRQFLARLSGVNALAIRVRNLETRMDQMNQQMFELSPPQIQISEEMRQRLKEISARDEAFRDVCATISKNDLMYQFILKQIGDPVKSYEYYLTSGREMLKTIETIAERKWGTFSEVASFLDFASGYGRMTRFAVQVLDRSKIWISDIKLGAVEFQKKFLGVTGIPSSDDPDEFKLAQTFDYIFVGSLFSHLPEATFRGWLQCLCDLLNENGIIVFTVHDKSLIKSTTGSSDKTIVFQPKSEEETLFSEEGRLPGGQYGTAYVSESFVGDVINSIRLENKRYFRYPKAMWGCQDLYIISKNPADDFQGLKF